MDPLRKELQENKVPTETKLKETKTTDKDGKEYKTLATWKDYPVDTHHCCNRCGYIKDKSYFVKDKGVGRGVRNICKFCKNAKLRELTIERKKMKNNTTAPPKNEVKTE